ncbi:hypothetical protein [Kordia sp.]|uniref:hypothetical protein n=1 Tax=Kordia sp. TaxID=1965332 RepID=UPI003B5A2062
MKIQKLLLVLLPFFISSCTKTIVEKEIVYLQKINDTILKFNSAQKDGELYKFNILRYDTILTHNKNFGVRKSSFDRFDSIYNIQATFEEKHIKIDRYDEYIQKTVVKDVTQTDSVGLTTNYIVTGLTQRYQDLELSGLKGTKHTVQFFHPESICNSAYELNFYSDDLQIYDHAGYFLTTIFGCCTSTCEFKLFDLNGNYIFHSNDFISLVRTEYNYYLISALKTEVYDLPIIVIQDKYKKRQYVNIANIPNKMNYVENFHLKFKNSKTTQIGSFETSLKEYNIKHLDDLEILVPFGKIDTLRIPFKNEKAFGIDYPHIEISLEN